MNKKLLNNMHREKRLKDALYMLIDGYILDDGEVERVPYILTDMSISISDRLKTLDYVKNITNNMKYIEIKHPEKLQADILNLILEKTNAGLISIELNSKVRKFIKEIKSIPLSEELQK